MRLASRRANFAAFLAASEPQPIRFEDRQRKTRTRRPARNPYPKLYLLYDCLQGQGSAKIREMIDSRKHRDMMVAAAA